jgi:hypothetical protein
MKKQNFSRAVRQPHGALFFATKEKTAREKDTDY